MKTLVLIIALLVPATALADTACYIYVEGDCHGWVASQTWFGDDWNGSGSNASVCLHRARDYTWWCGLQNAGDQVLAAFNVDGTTVNAQAFKPGFGGGGPTVQTFGMGWTPIATSALESYVSGLPEPRPPLTPRLNPHALPLDDQRYASDGPHWGYVYACDAMMFSQQNGPGGTGGPWLDVPASTYDVTAKVFVQGNVYYSDAWFAITSDASWRYISGNGLPVGLPTGAFPVSTSDPSYQYDHNPNSVTAQTIGFAVARAPTVDAVDHCVYKEIGITLDGIQIHAPVDSGGRNEFGYQTEDTCTGKPQPGGGYHRHGMSSCSPHIHEPNHLVGYALDGFGIFSPFDENGVEITSADLDECHGRVSPIPWEGQVVNMYHYVMTRDFPYTVACFKGVPTRNAFPALPGAPPQTR